MSSADTIVVPGRNSTIYRPVDEVDGVRVVESLATTVSVYAGPSNRIAQLIQFGQLKDRPLMYIRRSEAVHYIGVSGNGDRRLCKQLKNHLPHGEVFVVCWRDDRIGMKTARYFEARCIQFADEAGTKLDNQVRPHIPEMTASERADHERLLFDALFLVYDTGCRALQKTKVSPEKKRGKIALADAYVAIGTLKIPSNASTFELKANGVWARGFQVGNRFYVMPGSEYCVKATDSLTAPIVLRRKKLEQDKILAPIAGVQDRKRLVTWLNCKSDAIAAKILTGWQVNSKVWKKAPRCPLVRVVD
jgi:hypothetical protein